MGRSGTIHADVREFFNELHKLKPDRDEFVYLRYVRVHPNDIRRVGSLISELATHLAPFGFMFKNEGNRVSFSKSDADVEFGVEAPRKRLISVSKFGSKQRRFEHVGKFHLRIYSSGEAAKRNWVDTDGRKIEQSLDEIVECFRISYLAADKRRKEQRAHQERCADLAELRKLAQLRHQREEERVKLLTWIADSRREIDDLKKSIDTASREAILPADYSRMIGWAKRRLKYLEESTAVDGIQAALVERQLYPEPDHLLQAEGAPTSIAIRRSQKVSVGPPTNKG